MNEWTPYPQQQPDHSGHYAILSGQGRFTSVGVLWWDETYRASALALWRERGVTHWVALPPLVVAEGEKGFRG